MYLFKSPKKRNLDIEKMDLVEKQECIKNYVITGNYRSLKHLLLGLEIAELHLLNSIQISDESLLLITAKKWANIQYTKTNSSQSLAPTTQTNLYDYETVARVLTAFGAKDAAAADYLFRDYQRKLMNLVDCNLVNELHHTIGQYLEQHNQSIVWAVIETIESFNIEDDLLNYYQLIRTKGVLLLSDSDSWTSIRDAYNKQLKMLTNLSSPTYINQMEKVIDEPASNANFSQGWDQARVSVAPFLSECACSYFNRKQGSRRNQLEIDILSQAKAQFPANTTEQINYLSMGVGEGLQDFILIGRLIKQGYRFVNVVLVDPHLRTQSIRQLKDLNLLATKYNVNLKIEHYDSIQNFSESCETKFHLIIGIDFENIFKSNGFADVLYAHKLLDENGRFLFII
jgi:hypothetical protein